MATGIVNVWDAPSEDVAAGYRRVTAAYPDRLILLRLGFTETDFAGRRQRPARRRARRLGR